MYCVMFAACSCVKSNTNLKSYILLPLEAKRPVTPLFTTDISDRYSWV